MRLLGGITKHIRSNLIAYVALFFALSGTAAYASHLTVYSSDIVDGQVFSVDVANSSLTGSDVATGSLTGSDVATDSLSGSDIWERGLSVAAMGCQTGKVLGFARVKGSASIPSFYTTSSSYIDITNNCAGGGVFIRRVSTGVYHIKFAGNPAILAVASPNADTQGTESTQNDNIITVAKFNTSLEGQFFRVEVQDSCGDCSNGTDPQDGWFTILLP